MFIYYSQGQRSNSIFINVLDDDQPELDQQFQCSLTSVQERGQLGLNNKVNVVILASDKPYGEYMVTMETRNIIAREPSSSNNGSFIVGYVVNKLIN